MKIEDGCNIALVKTLQLVSVNVSCDRMHVLARPGSDTPPAAFQHCGTVQSRREGDTYYCDYSCGETLVVYLEVDMRGLSIDAYLCEVFLYHSP